MSHAQLSPVVRHLRTLVEAQTLLEATDDELLGRFTAKREEAAFAALLRRHGPMVLSVGRRLLGHVHDAEDVFQATFLLLARKAATIRKQASVSSWLHGVAYRLALKARSQQARRQALEKRAQTMAKTTARVDATWQELNVLLDAALLQLPEKHRTALVLFYLEGKSHEEAARQLGCPIATFRSWLARGRKRLRGELTRRGLTLSAVGFASLLATSAADGTVTATLLGDTLRAALQFTSEKAGAGAVSAQVGFLVEAGLKATMVAKLKLGMFVLVGSILAAGAGLAAYQGLGGGPAPREQDSAPKVAAERETSGGTERQDQEHTDRYGDPLPAGSVARLGTLRFYHGQNVDRVLLSHDARLVVSTARGDNRLWDAGTGRELPLREGLRRAFVFTWNDKLLAAEDGGKIGDLETGKEGPRPNVTRWAPGVNEPKQIMSPDGAIRAMAEANRIRLWDARTGKELPPLDKQQPSFEGRTDELVNSLAFSPDSKLLASTHPGPTVRLWDLAAGKEIRRFRGKGSQVFRVVFSADGKTLAGADSRSVTLWDIATGKRRHDFAHTYLVGALAFTPDGKTLLTGSAYNDPVIRVWDPVTGREKGEWRGHTVDVQTLAVSPDGKFAVSGSSDLTLRLWDVAAGKQARRFSVPMEPVFSASFSPDGKTVASAGRKLVRLWDASTGREVRAFSLGSYPRIAFAPDGKTLASASGQDDAVVLCDVATGREVRRFAGHASKYPSFAISPNGRTLATGDQSGVIHFWELTTGKGIARRAYRCCPTQGPPLHSRPLRFRRTAEPWRPAIRMRPFACGKSLRDKNAAGSTAIATRW
jgi:RNA polymerase sigma factor (sigma-70 family)